MTELKTLLTAGSLYVLGTALLTLYCWLKQWRERHHIKHKERLLEHLLKLLGSGELNERHIYFHKKDLRSALATLSKVVSGPMIDQARSIYTQLGFLRHDIQVLRKKGRRTQRIRILMQIRALHADLPPELWTQLIRDRSTAIRWLAMEAYIDVKGKHSMAKLFAFAQDPANQRLGVLVHLFSLYASHNGPGLVTILRDKHTKGMARLALLITLRHYPDPAAEAQVLSIILSDSHTEIQRCGIEALRSFASDSVLEHLLKFSRSQEASIRQAVAFALNESSHEKALEILEALTVDACHRVRRQAIDSLCSSSPYPENILAPIRSESRHPSYEILVARETFSGKAA